MITGLVARESLYHVHWGNSLTLCREQYSLNLIEVPVFQHN